MSFTEHRALGRTLWETTQVVNRAFERTLAEVGGSRAVWFIFLALAAQEHATQRDLAATVGITEATLTHHLNALELRALVTRTRDERDRRIQRIEFTEEGRAAFERILAAATAFNRRLVTAVGGDLDTLYAALDRLAAAADADHEAVPSPLAETHHDIGL